MGKTKKLYLAKRILAMILAAAVSVTMIPSTALAAEVPGSDRSSEAAGADNSADDAAAADNGTDVPADGSSPVNGGTGATDGVPANGGTGATDGVPVKDSADADGGTPANQNADGTGTQEDAPAAAVYEISIGNMQTEAVYSGYAPFDISGAVVTKTVDGQTTERYEETVTAAWQVQGADGNFTALADEPVNAGAYKLTLTCAAVAGVHDALTKEVTCTIRQRSLTITATANAKPGDAAVKESVKATAIDVDALSADRSVLTADAMVLEVTGVREAYGSSLKPEDVFKKDGDYVADVKPSIKADNTAAKEAAKNYEIPESIPVNIEIDELITTRVFVTLADKWKDANAVTLEKYAGEEAAPPKEVEDYTYEVRYEDGTAPDGYTKLANVEVVGAWAEYPGCEKDEDGKVKAPTDAGGYEYVLTFEGNDKYSESRESILVVIEPMPVTVEITNAEKLTVPAGTSMVKALSRVTYKATAKDRDNKDKGTINVETNHIWGTGYDDKNVSQVYEPAFTLQIKNGSAWENIEDANYKLAGGKEYRVIYDGKKAIYNADGSYAHRTGINSGLNPDGEEINGVDGNYITDETPTADDKALQVEVQPGAEMEWDLAALLADGKAGKTVEEATAKEFDDKGIYEKKNDYKSNVKLKNADKTLEAVGNDFTYTWYRSDVADDLLGKQIWDQNKTNGFVTNDFYDDGNWISKGSIVAPSDAGIYKLEITYQDKTDDDVLYTVKDDAKAVVYYVINKVALTITPNEGAYEVLAGRTPYGYFVEDKKIDEITYTVKKGDEEYKFPESLGNVVPQWGALESITDETGVSTRWYEEANNSHGFRAETGYTYEIQAQSLGYRVYEDGEYSYFGDGKISNNYTLYQGEKKETDVGGKMRAERNNKLLSGRQPLTVKPMGTTELTFEAVTPLALEKTYDGKALTEEEMKQVAAAYALKANGQQVTDLDVTYTCVEKSYGETPLLELYQAGEYKVYVNFHGSADYAPLKLAETDSGYGKLIGTIQIKKREISLTLDVDDTYEAGYMRQLYEDARGLKFTGYAEADEDKFSRVYGGLDGLRFYVNEKGSSDRVDLNEYTILKRGKEFEIHYDKDNSYLSWYFYDENGDYIDNFDIDRNYEVKDAAEVQDTFKTVAKPAEVKSVQFGQVKSLNTVRTALEQKNDGIVQTIEVREGIPYAAYNEMEGNLAAFRIYAPEEFDDTIPDTAMYVNAIEAVGGKIVSTYKNRGYFVALFNAAEGEKKVNIRWEDGYVETIIFMMGKDLCLGDLSKAVAPKSLAFNGAPKKLAVGESVQLDVKITKKQMTDVICLGYESNDEKVMHVDPDSGYVTALKKAKATITVYPKQMDKDGKMVKIPGFKPVTVTIEGTALTAPKAVKVMPHGSYALVNYDRIADGYRREIYVMEGKKNAKDFEDAVKKVQGNNGSKNQWRGTFAIAPIYLDSADESYGQSMNGFWYKARLVGLQSTGQYTVYVRNVCEAKTLSDGYKITRETVDGSAAGTAAVFTCLKSEVLGLDLKLDETVDGIEDITGYAEVPEFITGSNRVYKIDYSKVAKGVDSAALGKFSDTAAGDSVIKKLPLKDKNSVYQEPKLEYYLDGTDKNGNWAKVTKTDYMSVDKKGKIKFTGVGGYHNRYNPDTGNYESSCPCVYVRDANTGETAVIHLWVVADVDSVTAKKSTVNMTVGQTQDLNSIALYTYKVGKSKLATYRWPDMDMTAVREAIKAQKQSEYFELVENAGELTTVLRTIKAGGKLELSLTDKTVKKNAAKAADATAKITFLSKDLTPVKKIKAVDVTNEQFGLTFTAAGYPNAFRVEISDSSGNMLLDKRYANDGKYYVVKVMERAKDRGAWVWVKDTYRINASQIKKDVAAGGDRNRLAKDSQYTVKITALCGDVAAKAATAKVKTTKIPAKQTGLEDEGDSAWDWIVDHNNGKGRWVWTPPKGGMSIQVSESGTQLNSGTTWLYVLSGNSYTLTAQPDNRGRVNDTLVWTVGDKKVASVKAAAGTYCITLKGLQPGQTTLEVKSKILNKTIARYGIQVAAVGDAYGSGYRYYGDDEGENPDPEYNKGHYGDDAADYLPLSVGDKRKVKDEYQSVSGSYNYCGLFSFTAPETGVYAFRVGNSSVSRQKKQTKSGSSWSFLSNNGDLGWMQEGDTVWLRSRYSTNTPYYVWVEQTQRMEPATDGMTVTGTGSQETFQFKASDAGVYEFTLPDSSGTKTSLSLFTDISKVTNSRYDEYGEKIIWEMQKGDIVYLQAFLSNGIKYTLSAKPVEPAADGEKITSDGSQGIFQFKASDAGVYKLTLTDANGSTEYLSLYKEFDQMKNGTYDDSGNMIICELAKDETVWIKTSSYLTAGETYTLGAKPVKLAADGEKITGDGSQEIFQFKASDAGVYKLTLTDANGSTEYLSLYKEFDQMKNGTYDDSGNMIICELAKDETVWIKTSSYLTKGQTYTLGVENVTPEGVPAGEVSISSENNTLYAFMAQTAGIYHLTLTVPTANASDVTLQVWDDVMAAITENGSPLATSTVGADTDGKTTLSVDLILEAGQTVYLNPVNSSSAAVSVSMNGTKDDSITTVITEAGTSITVAGNVPAKATFTAQKTGIYTFTTEALSEAVSFSGCTGGEYNQYSADVSADVSNGDSLSKNVALKAGQMVVWTMSAGAETTLTMKVKAVEGIGELEPGQSAQARVFSSSDASNGQATAAGFLFTAPEAGYYSFWGSNGEYMDTYALLCRVDEINGDTCLLYNNKNESGKIKTGDDEAGSGQFGISYSLSKGQTVYLKCMMYNSSNSGTFTVHAAKGQNAWQN